MAEFNINFSFDFTKDLLETDWDEICETILNDTVEILEGSLLKEVRKEIMHTGDSELANSFKGSKAFKCKNGAWIVSVKSVGSSSIKKYVKYKNKQVAKRYPVSNALKGIWLEYGVPGRQTARPFIARATSRAEPKIFNKLQEGYNKKIGAK